MLSVFCLGFLLRTKVTVVEGTHQFLALVQEICRRLLLVLACLWPLASVAGCCFANASCFYLWPEGRNPRVGTPSGGIRENGAS